MFKIIQAVFVKSIVEQKDRPKPYLPEFAFAGRSNVGKSSLINSMVNRSHFARVSKSPGKTRTINFYKINQQFYFVDLPGYGYARVSKSEKQKWQKMVENYLIQNPYLKVIYVLIDSQVGLKENDIELFKWLYFNKLPYKIILTKTDRISHSEKVKILSYVTNTLQLISKNHIFLFSAKTNFGRQEVWNDILSYLPPY